MTTSHTATPLKQKAAKAFQDAREAENIANHKERVMWLSGECPCWSDGEPVGAHYRHVLLLQSKEALAKAGAA